jgi:hypothetical protein
MAEVAAGTLEHLALLDQPRQAVAFQHAAHGPRPAVADEGFAVLGLEGVDDALLQGKQVVAHRGAVETAHFLMAR